jgi:hypothetical protein
MMTFFDAGFVADAVIMLFFVLFPFVIVVVSGTFSHLFLLLLLHCCGDCARCCYSSSSPLPTRVASWPKNG